MPGKVSIKVVDAALDEVMGRILEGTDLEWIYTDNVITVRKKKKSSSTYTPVSIEDSSITFSTVSGKVTDANGDPIPGATVLIKRNRDGITTDAEGNFTLQSIKKNDVLLISSIGYETREIPVKGKTILAELNLVINKLDETVIIAYGTTTKRLNTGNISTVKAKDIEKQPINNPLLALQGRVPGLFIEQASGIPGSGVRVRIQGQNSLSRGSDPLYVIDGVPYISQMLYGLSDIQGRSDGVLADDGSGNPLSYINPSDIESIEILKDADATSIYGSRAAAGAILITTKKGKSGKTKVDLNLQKGWGKVGHSLQLLNTPQYLEMRREAKMNDGADIRATDYDINGTWDSTRYTDWQKKLIGGTANYTNAQLNASGGTATTTFLVGAGYYRETTVFPGDLNDQKYSFHLNINHASFNQRLKLQVDGKYLVDDNQLMGGDLTANALQLAPNAPSLYNSDGSLNWAPNASGISTWINPLAYLLIKYRNQVNNLIGNAVISYQLLPGLDIKTNLGYTNLSRRETKVLPLSYNAPENRAFATRYSYFGDDLIRSWIVEPQATYKSRINKGSLDILIGATFLKNQSNQEQLTAAGFTSDLLLENMGAASTVTPDKILATIYKYNALFARINYNWKEKYILNLTARRDGSSRFGSQNLFHNFGSIGGAWIFSNEPFLQKHLPLLSFGKIRVSYGTTGNDQIGEYQFMNLYYSRSRTVPYQDVTGLYTADYPNPYLQWEQTRKLQVGLEAGILSDRILLNLTYYHNRSSNQLQSYTLPILTGSTGITINFPATIQNSGWEISLNTTNIQNKNGVNWNSAANLTLPKNKLIAYDNLEQSSLATTYIVGKPFTIVRLFHSSGVDPATGDYRFLDSKGNYTSYPAYPDDATVLINSTPKFYGGIQNNISYKGWSLDFLFQFVKQVAVNYGLGDQPGRFNSSATSFSVRGNQPVSVLDRWQKPGDNRPIQRFSTTLLFPYYNALNSDGAYSDASYIRLKNLSLSWQFPSSWLQKAKLQQARLFAQGQNLLTFTKYDGLDPESRSSTSIPPLRVWTLGVQIVL